MTKEERKERRAKNKAKRQERRSKRKAQFQELMQKINDGPSLPDDGSTPEYQEGFKQFWPLIKSALTYVMDSKITGKKMDVNIREIIDLGNDIAEGEDASDFRDKLLKIWKIIRFVLIAITVFNGDEADDDKIDKVVEIGDYISGYDMDSV